MSRWGHPVLALTNPLKTTRWTHRANQRFRAALRAPVVRLVKQSNARQLDDFPAQGPDPWMWYVYAQTQPMHTYHDVVPLDWLPDGSSRRVYRHTFYPGPLGKGRNLTQALRDYNRRLAWAKRGVAVL
jgi:hypothetical protein